MLSLFAKAGEYCKGEPDEGEADPKVYSNNLIKHEGLEPHPLDTFNEDLGKWKLHNVKSSYVCPVAWAVTITSQDIEHIEAGAEVTQGALKGTLTKELKSGAATSFSITSTNDITFNTENKITIGDLEITAEAITTITKTNFLLGDYKIGGTGPLQNGGVAVLEVCEPPFHGDETGKANLAGKMNAMFFGATKFNSGKNCAAKPNPASLNLWDVKGVIDMSDMFGAEDSEIGQGPIGCFNGIISDWNTGKVVRMTRMFRGSKFDKDISKWYENKMHIFLQFIFLI